MVKSFCEGVFSNICNLLVRNYRVLISVSPLINWISKAGKAKCTGVLGKAAGNPVSKISLVFPLRHLLVSLCSLKLPDHIEDDVGLSQT